MRFHAWYDNGQGDSGAMTTDCPRQLARWVGVRSRERPADRVVHFVAVP